MSLLIAAVTLAANLHAVPSHGDGAPPFTPALIENTRRLLRAARP